MFTSGAYGAQERAYMGGDQGMADLMTQGTLGMLRSGIGQMTTLSLMSDPRLLKQVLAGGTPTVEAMMGAVGNFAAKDPTKVMALRARGAYAMESMDPDKLQELMFSGQMARYKTLTGNKGKMDPDDMIGFLIAQGQDPRAAMAMVDTHVNGDKLAKREREKITDAVRIAQFEATRGGGIGRRVEKWVDRNLRGGAADIYAKMDSAALGYAENIYDKMSGTHVYDKGAFEAEIGSPMGLLNAQADAREEMTRSGYDTKFTQANVADIIRDSKLGAAGEIFAGPGGKALQSQMSAQASAAGLRMEDYTKLARDGAVNVKLDEGMNRTVRESMMAATGMKDAAAAESEYRAHGGKHAAAFESELKRRGLGKAYGDAYMNDGSLVLSKADVDKKTNNGLASVHDRLVSSNAVEREGIRVRAGLESDTDSAGTEAALQRYMKESGKGETEARAAMDTYLNRTKEDNPDQGNFFGKGPTDRDFTYVGKRSGSRVALTPEDTEKFNTIFTDAMKDNQKFQKDHLGFLAGLGSKDERELAIGTSQVQGMVTSGRIGEAMSAMNAGNKADRFAALANVMMPGVAPDQMNDMQQKHMGAMAQALSQHIKGTSDGSTAQREALDNLVNAGSTSIDTNAAGLEALETNRRKGVDSMGDDMKEAFTGANFKQRIELTDMLTKQGVARLLDEHVGNRTGFMDAMKKAGYDDISKFGITDEDIAKGGDRKRTELNKKIDSYDHDTQLLIAKGSGAFVNHEDNNSLDPRKWHSGMAAGVGAALYAGGAAVAGLASLTGVGILPGMLVGGAMSLAGSGLIGLGAAKGAGIIEAGSGGKAVDTVDAMQKLRAQSKMNDQLASASLTLTDEDATNTAAYHGYKNDQDTVGSSGKSITALFKDTGSDSLSNMGGSRRLLKAFLSEKDLKSKNFDPGHLAIKDQQLDAIEKKQKEGKLGAKEIYEFMGGEEETGRKFHDFEKNIFNPLKGDEKKMTEMLHRKMRSEMGLNGASSIASKSGAGGILSEDAKAGLQKTIADMSVAANNMSESSKMFKKSDVSEMIQRFKDVAEGRNTDGSNPLAKYANQNNDALKVEIQNPAKLPQPVNRTSSATSSTGRTATQGPAKGDHKATG